MLPPCGPFRAGGYHNIRYQIGTSDDFRSPRGNIAVDTVDIFCVGTMDANRF